MRPPFLACLFVVLLLALPARAERTLTSEELAPLLRDLSAPFEHMDNAQRAQLFELYKLEG